MTHPVLSGAPARPHSFRPLTTRGINARFAIALIPALVAALARFSWWPGAFVAAGTVVGADVVIRAILRKPFLETGEIVVFALLWSILVPWSGLLWPVVLGGVAIVAVGVWGFGGPGMFWMHPVLVGYALSSLVAPGFPGPMAAAAVPGIARAAEVTVGLVAPIVESVTGTILSPDGLFGLFGVEPGIGADAAPLLLLAGSVYLQGEDVTPPAGPLAFLVGLVAVLSLFGVWPLPVVFSGRTLVASFWLLSYPGVRPRCVSGMMLHGVVAGAIAALFVVFGAGRYPGDSVLLGLFAASLLMPLVDETRIGCGS